MHLFQQPSSLMPQFYVSGRKAGTVKIQVRSRSEQASPTNGPPSSPRQAFKVASAGMGGDVAGGGGAFDDRIRSEQVILPQTAPAPLQVSSRNPNTSSSVDGPQVHLRSWVSISANQLICLLLLTQVNLWWPHLSVDMSRWNIGRNEVVLRCVKYVKRELSSIWPKTGCPESSTVFKEAEMNLLPLIVNWDRVRRRELSESGIISLMWCILPRKAAYNLGIRCSARAIVQDRQNTIGFWNKSGINADRFGATYFIQVAIIIKSAILYEKGAISVF